MKFLIVLSLLLSGTSFAQVNNDNLDISNSITSQFSPKLKKLRDIVSFSYGVQYLGPSLSDNYQDGATYNRFNTGQDWQGVDTDPTGSNQIYHSFSLGFQVHKRLKLSYSMTFQEELNNNIKYNIYNKDGSVWAQDTRETGVSHNNHRINAFFNNIYGNSYIFLMTNVFYEIPTTKGSRDSDMLYGLGIQPVVIIYSKIPGLYHGVRGSIERDYYKRQEYTYDCGGFECTQVNQTLRASLTGYIGYNTSDRTNWNLELKFDWDQDGDQVDSGVEFNPNMDDVVEIGPNYTFSKNVFGKLRLQYAINDPKPENSAFIGSLTLSI